MIRIHRGVVPVKHNIKTIRFIRRFKHRHPYYKRNNENGLFFNPGPIWK